MKVFVLVLTALLVTGCGTYMSMEQLEQQALLTGDWTAVEKRERTVLRRKLRHGNVCPAGQVAVCESFASVDRCTCVESSSLRTVLAGR